MAGTTKVVVIFGLYLIDKKEGALRLHSIWAFILTCMLLVFPVIGVGSEGDLTIGSYWTARDCTYLAVIFNRIMPRSKADRRQISIKKLLFC